MVIRECQSSDQGRLAEIANQYEFPINLDNTFAHRVAVEKDRIIAFGWLQLVVEANVIWDMKNRHKFEALKKILHQGKIDARSAGFDQVHAFPKDSRFSEILKKHYDFRDVTGDSLVLNLE